MSSGVFMIVSKIKICSSEKYDLFVNGYLIVG